MVICDNISGRVVINLSSINNYRGDILSFRTRCPNCSQDTKAGRFCERCGVSLADTEYSSVEKTKGVSIKKSSIKIGIICIIGFIILLCGFKAYKFYEEKNAAPQNVIKSILSSWKSNDYSKVYSYIDKSELSNEEFLSKEDFKNALNNNKLTEYSLEIIEEDTSYLSEINYNVTMVINGEKVNKEFVLEKKVTPDETKGKWFLNPNSLVTNIKATLPSYAALKINDKSVKASEEAGYSDLSMFIGYPMEIKYEGQLIKPEVKKLTVEENMKEININDLNISVTDEAKNKIVELIKNFTSVNNSITVDSDIAIFNNVLEASSDIWDSYNSRLTSGYYLPEKITKSVLDNISFDKNIVAHVKQSVENGYEGEEEVSYILAVDEKGNFKIRNID